MITRAILLCSLALLTACGSVSDDPLTNAARGAVTALGKGKTPAATLDQQRAQVRATVKESQFTDPVLMVELPRQNAVASLVIAGRNNGAITWLDATGVSVVTRDGVVISTRGLANDLMFSDTDGTRAALRSGGSGYSRVHRYLDGEGQLTDINFTCGAVRGSGTVTETCSVPSGDITNTYQLRGGSVVSSRQWIGRDVGYATLTRLQ